MGVAAVVVGESEEAVGVSSDEEEKVAEFSVTIGSWSAGSVECEGDEGVVGVRCPSSLLLLLILISLLLLSPSLVCCVSVAFASVVAEGDEGCLCGDRLCEGEREERERREGEREERRRWPPGDLLRRDSDLRGDLEDRRRAGDLER